MLTAIGGAIDINIPSLAHPSEFADLDLLMGLKLVMQEQPMLWASPDVVALDKLHLPLAYWAEPYVAVVH
jgi:hypothetical protein